MCTATIIAAATVIVTYNSANFEQKNLYECTDFKERNEEREQKKIVKSQELNE